MATLTTAALRKPACDLAGTDSITAIVLRVTKALDDAGQQEAGSIFWGAAMRLKRADLVIELARAYVELP
jgi:hypothetical protein